MAHAQNWALIFTDEASFRQDSTLHATWSRVGCPPEVPVTGERKNVKIFGAIELWRTRFHYAQDTVFNASTYGAFLEQLGRRYRRRGAILIQDNASYHKDKDVWSWFKSNRQWLEVHQLPAYCPELNPTERLWQHTRKGVQLNVRVTLSAGKGEFWVIPEWYKGVAAGQMDESWINKHGQLDSKGGPWQNAFPKSRSLPGAKPV